MAELGSVTRALLGMVGQEGDERALAERICRACVAGLDVDGAAVSLFTGSDLRQTLWATDPVADRLEELQFTLAEGACMEAARTGRAVLVPDVHLPAGTGRWPVFAAAVAEQTPVRALFAVPLQWGAVNLGVLDLYRTVPGGLADVQWRDLLAAVDTATLMILGLRTHPDPSADGAGGWLDHAIDHRAEIHQATGMVLAQLGVGPVDALARMRGHAFAHQRLLIEVARDVLARRLVFTEDMA